MRFLLSILSVLISFGSYAQDYYTTCFNCSSFQMKQKAQSFRASNYAFSNVSVFDEYDKEYRRYRLSTRFIDDAIEVTVATEANTFSDVRTAFNEYIEAKKLLKNSIGNIEELDIEANGVVQSSVRRTSINYSAKSTSNCQAKTISSDAITAHDYVNNSQNRRVLFYKVKSTLDNVSGGKVAIMTLKYGSFLNKLENHSNNLVSFLGTALGALDITHIKMNTADGGFIKGYMNFKTESFDISSATDGDCNDLPVDANNIDSRYDTSSGASADKMIELLLGYGGRLNIPVCQKETKVCTGIHGQTLSCYSICFQWK